MKVLKQHYTVFICVSLCFIFSCKKRNVETANIPFDSVQVSIPVTDAAKLEDDIETKKILQTIEELKLKQPKSPNEIPKENIRIIDVEKLARSIEEIENKLELANQKRSELLLSIDDLNKALFIHNTRLKNLISEKQNLEERYLSIDRFNQNPRLQQESYRLSLKITEIDKKITLEESKISLREGQLATEQQRLLQLEKEIGAYTQEIENLKTNFYYGSSDK